MDFASQDDLTVIVYFTVEEMLHLSADFCWRF